MDLTKSRWPLNALRPQAAALLSSSPSFSNLLQILSPALSSATSSRYCSPSKNSFFLQLPLFSPPKERLWVWNEVQVVQSNGSHCLIISFPILALRTAAFSLLPSSAGPRRRAGMAGTPPGLCPPPLRRCFPNSRMHGARGARGSSTSHTLTMGYGSAF